MSLALKQKHFRKYPQLTFGDKVNIYTKGAGNYISRKETVSRWSDKQYTLETIDRDMTLQKYLLQQYFLLEGLKSDICVMS